MKGKGHLEQSPKEWIVKKAVRANQSKEPEPQPTDEREARASPRKNSEFVRRMEEEAQRWEAKRKKNEEEKQKLEQDRLERELMRCTFRPEINRSKTPKRTVEDLISYGRSKQHKHCSQKAQQEKEERRRSKEMIDQLRRSLERSAEAWRETSGGPQIVKAATGEKQPILPITRTKDKSLDKRSRDKSASLKSSLSREKNRVNSQDKLPAKVRQAAVENKEEVLTSPKKDSMDMAIYYNIIRDTPSFNRHQQSAKEESAKSLKDYQPMASQVVKKEGQEKKGRRAGYSKDGLSRSPDRIVSGYETADQLKGPKYSGKLLQTRDRVKRERTLEKQIDSVYRHEAAEFPKKGDKEVKKETGQSRMTKIEEPAKQVSNRGLKTDLRTSLELLKVRVDSRRDPQLKDLEAARKEAREARGSGLRRDQANANSLLNELNLIITSLK